MANIKLTHIANDTFRICDALIVFACSGILLCAGAYGQTYPTKPIRLIVPYASGGNGEILARVVSQKLGEAFGQQVVVDNRAGANGIIGTDLCAKAAPDGYTLLFVGNGHATNPALYGKLPYDSIRWVVTVERLRAVMLGS